MDIIDKIGAGFIFALFVVFIAFFSFSIGFGYGSTYGYSVALKKINTMKKCERSSE